jgi:hypothetical protein
MTLDREKLAKILGLVGSVHDGEALLAARRAHGMLAAAGLTWHDAVAADIAIAAEVRRLASENESLRDRLARAEADVATTPTHWRQPDDDEEAIDLCIRCAGLLTPWEREFTISLAGRWEKQHDRLWRIVAKLGRIARARGAVA